MSVTTVESSHLALTLALATQLCQVPDPYGLAFIFVLVLMTIHSQLNFMSHSQKLKKSQLMRKPECFTPLSLYYVTLYRSSKLYSLGKKKG